MTDPGRRRTKIFVILFMLIAVLSAIWGSIVFKQMVDNEELQQKLDEVRNGDTG